MVFAKMAVPEFVCRTLRFVLLLGARDKRWRPCGPDELACSSSGGPVFLLRILIPAMTRTGYTDDGVGSSREISAELIQTAIFCKRAGTKDVIIRGGHNIDPYGLKNPLAFATPKSCTQRQSQARQPPQVKSRYSCVQLVRRCQRWTTESFPLPKGPPSRKELPCRRSLIWSTITPH